MVGFLVLEVLAIRVGVIFAGTCVASLVGAFAVRTVEILTINVITQGIRVIIVFDQFAR